MKIINKKHKLSIIEVILTLIFTPVSFPIIVFVTSLFGLSNLRLFSGWTIWLFQILTLLTILGFIISYNRHRSVYPLIISIVSTVIILYGCYFSKSDNWSFYLYLGMIGFIFAIIANYYHSKLHSIKIENSSNSTILHNK